jgi:TolB-like protein/predicted Ser/Thr protein kinase
MTAEENRRVPLSTKVSPREAEVDPQLSACAQEGPPPGGLPVTQPPGRRRSATGRAQAGVSSSTVRLAIGQLLGGRYRIERELAEGGMGVVYLAADEQVPGERFAIKVLKEELHPEALTLLREEVRKTRKLSHPNIVDVHSVNVDAQRLYVLMEYLEGRSLNALLDEEFGRGMPFSHAWPIIEDVGAALGNAHDHNVIHSDLKPANVFVTTSGRTKLLDFGIARVSRGPLLHARSGSRALTPAYASCEMLEGKEADRRDDIYSFACVIYEMLCGERPFGELTALEAREAGTQVPPHQGLSRRQNAALAQALAFDRERRTASVEKLLEGLAADRRPRGRPIAVLGGAIIAALAALGVTYLVLDKLWISRYSVVLQSVAPDAQPTASRASGTGATFNPPPHSIAVLPFVNMSGDASQQYFSDGLTEELLNSLSRTNELQVAAHTSSFSFQGEHPDIATVAHKLNVASVLEGSVRRSGHTIRVTAQLNNGVTGFNLWSQTYDRDLGDVLKLQTEIAAAVAGALKITLLGDVAERIELGGTRSPAAFDAYLRGSKAFSSSHDISSLQSAITEYTAAIRLDPSYALAFAGRSRARSAYATEFATGPAIREFFDKAQADAHQALKLTPELAEAHLALAFYFNRGALDFTRANEAYEHAVVLAPGNAEVLAESGRFAVTMGHFDAGLVAGRRAVALDPLGTQSRYLLGQALQLARRYEEAVAVFGAIISLDPDYKAAYGFRGLAYYGLGNFQSARSSCETGPDSWASQWCLAMANDKLGQHPDAAAMLRKLQTGYGDAGPVEYATIYAQWGNTAKALEWLTTAVQLRNQDLVYLKTEPLLDPLRKEPRFQAIERALKFPE